SIRPIAVWLNQGKSKFQKTNSWSYGVGRYTGPEYQHRQTSQPEPVGNISIDPLLQATVAVDYSNIGTDLIAVLAFDADRLPFDSILRQVPVRGPPATARV